MSEWSTLEQIWAECEGRPVWVELKEPWSSSVLNKYLAYEREEGAIKLVDVESENILVCGDLVKARLWREPKKKRVLKAYVYNNNLITAEGENIPIYRVIYAPEGLEIYNSKQAYLAPNLPDIEIEVDDE